MICLLYSVALGSIAELPAETCAEIKASEGEDAVSGNYWFSSIKPGAVVLAPCNMSTEGKWTFFQQARPFRYQTPRFLSSLYLERSYIVLSILYLYFILHCN